MVWHGLRAEAEARSSGAETDDEAIRRLRTVAERITRDSATAAGPVREAVTGYQELCSAEIGRVEGRSDPTAWARAAEVWERRNHPYPAAYARLRQAEALFAQRTRNAEAAGALRDAYRTARRLGAHPFTDEIRALAERARVPLDEHDAPGPGVTAADRRPDPAAGVATDEHRPTEGRQRVDELAALTKRELQVLARVAAGDTNREIAERLYISERTVGVHVSHILDKLQLRSRVQASAVYQRNQTQRRD
jgi:DNA-binding CsgD family transcriptional regulator